MVDGEMVDGRMIDRYGGKRGEMRSKTTTTSQNQSSPSTISTLSSSHKQPSHHPHRQQVK